MNVRRGANAAFFAVGLGMTLGGGLGVKAELESAAHNFAEEWHHLGTDKGRELADARRQDIYEGVALMAVSASGLVLMYQTGRDEFGDGNEDKMQIEITEAELNELTEQADAITLDA